MKNEHINFGVNTLVLKLVKSPWTRPSENMKPAAGLIVSVLTQVDVSRIKSALLSSVSRHFEHSFKKPVLYNDKN